MDTKVKKLITCIPESNYKAFLCDEKNGGRGLIKPELSYKRTTKRKYLNIIGIQML